MAHWVERCPLINNSWLCNTLFRLYVSRQRLKPVLHDFPQGKCNKEFRIWIDSTSQKIPPLNYSQSQKHWQKKCTILTLLPNLGDMKLVSLDLGAKWMGFQARGKIMPSEGRGFEPLQPWILISVNNTDLRCKRCMWYTMAEIRA